jgi:hypothetical protein
MVRALCPCRIQLCFNPRARFVWTTYLLEERALKRYNFHCREE